MTAFRSTSMLLRNNAQARVLLVGSGRMGNIRARALYGNPRIQLCGIVDTNIEQTKTLSELYRTPQFASLDEAISSIETHSTLDGVVISTPTPTHESLITKAAQNNLSIFTEKPVDETAKKISSLFQICNNHNVKLCCGYQRRFDLSYQSLYHQVNSGAIGTPLSATIFFGDHPVPSRQFLLQGGANIITDCSAHDIDFIRWTLDDEVVSVYAVGTSSDDELRQKNVIDNATMLMKFSRGTNVTLTLTRGANYGYDQRCEVFGTNGMATVKNVAENASELANEAGLHRPKWQHSFPQRFEAAFAQEMDAFADTLICGAPWPIKEVDCVAVQRVCDAALESCETSQVVHLERDV
jgi:myo-inositol 2-dehydrogenase/D-chiro-inositol 1-dehydrogenase